MIEAQTKEILMCKVEKSTVEYKVLGGQDKDSKKGAKSFLAFETHNDFLAYIKSKSNKDRNQYEIIDKNQISLWYMDIDSKDTTDPDGLLKTLISHLKAFLMEYDQLPLQGNWATKDNAVRARLHSLFISWLEANAAGFNTEILDSSVYSPWQNFRTIYSTKLGTERPLVPIEPKAGFDPLHYFVTYVSDQCERKVISLEDLPATYSKKEMHIQSKSNMVAGDPDTLESENCNLECTPILTHELVNCDSSGMSKNAHLTGTTQGQKGQNDVMKRGKNFSVPITKKFIEEEYQQLQVKLVGDTVMTYGEGMQMSAVMAVKDGICPFKGQRHKSNHIYFVLDTRGIVVRCHDSSCTGKEHVRTEMLPHEVAEELRHELSLKIRMRHCSNQRPKTANHKQRIDKTNSSKFPKKLVAVRNFGNYEEFPELYPDKALNQLCFNSLPGNSYQVAEFGAHLMDGKYIFVNGQWYEYTGSYWELTTGPDEFIVKDIVPIYGKLTDHYSKDKSKWLKMLADDLCNKSKRKQYVDDLEGILTKESRRKRMKLDADSTLLAFQNGVFDTKTCTFRDHSPETLKTRLLTYELATSSNASKRAEICQFFEQILPDTEVRKFMLQYLAMHLEGRNRHQIAAILTGTGGNGKGMLKYLMNITFEHLHSEPSSAFLTSERPSDERPAPNVVETQCFCKRT
ncbi:hypothetical protein HK100_007996 [Physocladia obscura]|uniref:Bacteriophage/plasmid primase P4 C-terminal domain-containing protein n=1 Tax=Physocladia obscura TaxID=109957 RepID=A0AAD5XAE4_9FUNG|nr:hypothetical protein HK100_007996 [Physocladia obscura]